MHSLPSLIFLNQILYKIFIFIFIFGLEAKNEA